MESNFCRVIVASDAIRFVAEARVLYRQSGLGSLGYIDGSSRKLEANFLSMQLQIGQVRSLADSERVRSACLKYLQRDLPYYCSERPDLIERSRELAESLGGKLEPPQLPWKYAWIQRARSWNAAKQTQLAYNRIKFSLVRSWDRALFQLEKRGS